METLEESLDACNLVYKKGRREDYVEVLTHEVSDYSKKKRRWIKAYEVFEDLMVKINESTILPTEKEVDIFRY